MRRIVQRGPSPALLVAVAALVAALAGTAIAGEATTSAVGKKKVRKIATKQIERLAPGLSVESADTATRADTATEATSAALAARAADSNRVGGATLPQITPVDDGFDDNCVPAMDQSFTDCEPGAVITTSRRADVLVMVTATWFSPEGIGVNAETNCRLEQNETNIGAIAQFGTMTNDTEEDLYERSIAWNDLQADVPPGTYRYEFSCRLEESLTELSDVRVIAAALGS